MSVYHNHKKCTEDTKITMFIQSLDKPEIRLSLIALQAALSLSTLDQVTDKAINVEDRAKLHDNPQTTQTEGENNHPSSMDIDNIQRGSKTGRQHNYKNKKYVDKQPSQPSTHLRAYDKHVVYRLT